MLTDQESAAIQIFVERALQDEIRILNMPLPKLQGLSSRFHKLALKLNERAAELDSKIAETDERSDKVFDKTQAHLDGFDQHLKDVNQFLDALEGSNSGELPPVDLK